MIILNYTPDVITVKDGGMEIQLHRSSFTPREWDDFQFQRDRIPLAQVTDLRRHSIWPACPLPHA
jgi:hypothetical protein